MSALLVLRVGTQSNATATSPRAPPSWRGPTASARTRRARRAGARLRISPVLSVAYFGPPGTFTEEALLTQDDLAAGERTPHASVPEVIAAVERGDADGGVVPIENMIEGSVSVTLDTLAFDSELLIQREIDLPVSLNLCAPAGVGARATCARSCRSRTRSRSAAGGWPRSCRRPSSRASHSTSDAAPRGRQVEAHATSPRSATRLAAELYGLDVLATEIEDHPENQTRFVLVGPRHPRADRSRQDVDRLLPARGPARARCSRSCRSSRPVRSTSRSSSRARPSAASATTASSSTARATSPTSSSPTRCATSRPSTATVKFLGSYPVGGPAEAGVERRRAAGRGVEARGDVGRRSCAPQIRDGRRRRVIDLKRLRDEPEYRRGIERKRVRDGTDRRGARARRGAPRADRRKSTGCGPARTRRRRRSARPRPTSDRRRSRPRPR